MYTNVQQRSNTFRTSTGSIQNQQFPPTPISGSYFSPSPQNAQVSVPGLQGSVQRYGSPNPYNNIPSRVGTPGTNSKKQQWIQQSIKNRSMIQSGQFQTSAIAWIFVSSTDVFPPSAINFGHESNQSLFICRSFYENQLRVGKVYLTHEGPRAFVLCKGKECQVRDYEVLVQSLALPQFSFVPNTSTASTASNNATIHFPVAQPAPLSGIDIVFVVDDSDSMEGERWNDVHNALSGVAHDCAQFDEDGFDLYFLNNDYFQQRINNSESIIQAFSEVSPDGATPTGERLRKVLDTYISRLEVMAGPRKPVGIIVITDGDPTDDVESVIVAAAQRLERAGLPQNQLHIHFIQIGDDQAATNALQRLDNALSGHHGIRDIVDTTLSQIRFRTQTLYNTVQTMWKKQTNESFGPATAVISTSQTFSPSPLSPLSPPYASSPPTLSRVQSSNNRSYHIGHQNTLSFAHDGLQTSAFGNRMDWVQQAQQLTATLKSSANLHSIVPYAWIFVDHDVAPPDAIVCGNENGQEICLCRSFYEGQLRYGTVVAGSMKAIIVNNGHEIPIDQYEVLVQPSGYIYSFEPEIPSTKVEMDIVIIVDDSDSMEGDHRWSQTRDVLAVVAEASPQFDSDGVDLYFLNSDVFRKYIKTRNEVIQLFNDVSPDGETPTGSRLEKVLNEYIYRLEQKSEPTSLKMVNIIVITDGDPTDDVESVIVNAAARLDRSQVPGHMLGIQFVQVGDDPDATRALQRLDDALSNKYNIRDMVDTTPFNPNNPQFNLEETLFKVLWGGINRQVDHMNEYRRA